MISSFSAWVNERDKSMWDTVGIIAAVVVIILLFQVLDVSEALKERLRGGSLRKDIERRVSQLEERLDAIERKND
jgi:hypothetical protein